MYCNFFDIEENPFSNTPNSKYLFMSERHKEALAHLIYGVEGGSGFVLLTGEVGCGKTTLSRYLAERLPENVELALCVNPRLTEVELLANICDDLGITVSGPPDSIKNLTSSLNAHLLDLYARGGSAVLIIDEAQNLGSELLEQIRLLTNLETTHNKLLQIILIGQPELKEFLEQPHLRQLSQRVTARYHLNPMTVEDTKNYIAHRASIARLPPDVFQAGAISEICRHSRGIPRLINSICERCLLGAYASGKKTINRKLARKAAAEVLGGPIRSRQGIVLSFLTGGVVGFVGLTFLAMNPLDLDIAPQITQSRYIVSLREVIARLPEVGQLFLTAREKDDLAAATSASPAEASAVMASTPDTDIPSRAVTRMAEFLTRSDTSRSSHGFALSRLFALWRPDAARQEDPTSCLEAATVGLACLGWEGSWDSLRRINLPSLIALRTQDGTTRFAVVRKLDGDMATLELAGRRLTTTLNDIAPFRTGGFLILWRPPDAYRRTLLPGMTGEDVEWLRMRLGEIVDTPFHTPTPDVYDNDLLVLLNNFKRRYDLKTDGIVDQLTFILLNNAVGGAQTPVLHLRS